MRTIYKYQLGLISVQEIEMPQNAKLLKIEFQGPSICLWAEVTDAPSTKRKILLCGTGHWLPEHKGYIGTVFDGSFVWHFFDGGEST